MEKPFYTLPKKHFYFYQNDHKHPKLQTINIEMKSYDVKHHLKNHKLKEECYLNRLIALQLSKFENNTLLTQSLNGGGPIHARVPIHTHP